MRISSRLGEGSEFRRGIERVACRLIEVIVRGEYGDARRELQTAEYLAKLGGDTGILNPAHTDAIIAETRLLDGAIHEFGHTSFPEIDVSSFFSDSRDILLRLREERGSRNRPRNQELSGSGTVTKDPAIILQYPASSGNNPAMPREGELPNLQTPAIERQDRIFAFIQKQQICRFKDIQSMLPEMSERTLRYDLQELQEQGRIERIGTSGPSTYYRARDEALAVPQWSQ